MIAVSFQEQGICMNQSCSFCTALLAVYETDRGFIWATCAAGKPSFQHAGNGLKDVQTYNRPNGKETPYFVSS